MYNGSADPLLHWLGSLGLGDFEMHETSTQEYARTLSMWTYWARRLNHGHDLRASAALQAYQLLAKERFAVCRTDFGLSRSMQRLRRERFIASLAAYELDRIVRRNRRENIRIGRMVSAFHTRTAGSVVTPKVVGKVIK